MTNSPRIVVIGSASVGKTCLINRIVECKFSSVTAPTTGTAFYAYRPEHPDHPEIQLWDTAGMERYRSLNKVFYREAVGAILVFDLTSYSSFQDLDSWLREFIANARSNPCIVLCGNKSDLQDEREVQENEIVSFCADHDSLNFFETSAQTGDGVSRMMKCLLDLLPKEAFAIQTTVLSPEEPKEKGCC
jgi:small GTP-binding protein